MGSLEASNYVDSFWCVLSNFPNHEIAGGEETFSVMLVRTQAKAKLNSSFFNNENCHEWRIVDNDDELTAKLENDNNGDTNWLWNYSRAWPRPMSWRTCICYTSCVFVSSLVFGVMSFYCVFEIVFSICIHLSIKYSSALLFSFVSLPSPFSRFVCHEDVDDESDEGPCADVQASRPAPPSLAMVPYVEKPSPATPQPAPSSASSSGFYASILPSPPVKEKPKPVRWAKGSILPPPPPGKKSQSAPIRVAPPPKPPPSKKTKIEKPPCKVIKEYSPPPSTYARRKMQLETDIKAGEKCINISDERKTIDAALEELGFSVEEGTILPCVPKLGLGSDDDSSSDMLAGIA